MDGKVRIKGKEYPLRMSMGTMLRFKRLTGREVGDIGSSDMEGMITLIYACAAATCNADGIEFGLSLEDFADNLDPDSFTEASLSLFGAASAEKKSK